MKADAKVVDAALTALRQGQLDAAARIVYDYQDASGRETDPIIRQLDLADLQLVFSVRPKILTGVTDNVLKQLRIAAGMGFLSLGTNWLPADLETGIRLDGPAAVQMIIVRVQTERNMRDWLRFGLVKTVKVLNSFDGPCDACLALTLRSWPLAMVPELPYEPCTSKGGCRCACAADSFVEI